MDIWQGVDEFLSLVETQSFVGAARKNGVSVAHISRQIKRLEERLGVQLVLRTTRKVSLTENGVLFSEHLQDIRRRMLNAVDETQGVQAQVKGSIKLSCAVGFASRELTSSLARFQMQYPDVDLRADYSGQTVDLTDDGFDLAIRFGKMNDSGIIARPLSRRPMALLASPGYLHQRGVPNTLNDLDTHNCLIAMSNVWKFEVEGKPVNKRVTGNWQTNNADALINASLQGLGVCYLAQDLVDQQLADGSLTSLMPEVCIRDNATWILYQRRDFMPHRIRLLIDHLVAECGDD